MKRQFRWFLHVIVWLALNIWKDNLGGICGETFTAYDNEPHKFPLNKIIEIYITCHVVCRAFLLCIKGINPQHFVNF
jgi:hypothetical protein